MFGYSPIPLSHQFRCARQSVTPYSVLQAAKILTPFTQLAFDDDISPIRQIYLFSVVLIYQAGFVLFLFFYIVFDFNVEVTSDRHRGSRI